MLACSSGSMLDLTLKQLTKLTTLTKVRITFVDKICAHDWRDKRVDTSGGHKRLDTTED